MAGLNVATTGRRSQSGASLLLGILALAAVGALHRNGERGLLAMLHRDGYHVTRIR